MTKKTTARGIFAVSVISFIFSIYAYLVCLDYDILPTIMTVILNSLSFGSAVCFFGLGFLESESKVYPLILLVNVVVLFVLNIAAAFITMGSDVMTLNLAGFAQIPALVALFIVLFCAFFKPQKLNNHKATLIAILLSLSYIAMIISEYLISKGNDIRLILSTVLSYLQMAVVCWWPVSEVERK